MILWMITICFWGILGFFLFAGLFRPHKGIKGNIPLIILSGPVIWILLLLAWLNREF